MLQTSRGQTLATFIIDIALLTDWCTETDRTVQYGQKSRFLLYHLVAEWRQTCPVMEHILHQQCPDKSLLSLVLRQIRTIKTDNNRQSYRMKTTCWRQVARKTCARLHGRKLRLEERRVCYYHVADTNRLKTIYLLHHQTKFCCHCVTGNLSNRLTKFGNTRRDVIFLLTDMLQTNVYEDRQQSAKH